MSTNPEMSWDQAAEAQRQALRTELAGPLLAHLTKRDHLYDGERLRVGTDMKPDDEACERAIYYRLRRVPADPPQLARRLRYERGNFAQRILAAALRDDGREVEEEVAAKALRPSAWAWGDGHGDVLDVRARHLYEVKAPGLDAWRRATGMPRKLVRESYRWQLSWYYHELKRTGRIDTASWVFFDLEGENDPVEVPLTDDLLVPLSAITAMEEKRSRILWATEPPARPQNTVVVTKVLKGGRKTKKNPTPERQVHAVSKRAWMCSYCDWAGTCQPGPEESPVSLAPDDPVRLAAVREAEAQWAAEDAEKARAKVAPEVQDQDMDAPPLAVVASPPESLQAHAEPQGGGASASIIFYPAVVVSGRSVPCSCGFAERKRDDHAEGCPSASWTGPSRSDRKAADAELAESMREIDERAARGEPVVRTDESRPGDSGGW